MILDDDATFCKGALQRLVDLLRNGTLATHDRLASVEQSRAFAIPLATQASSGVHGVDGRGEDYGHVAVSNTDGSSHHL